MLMVPKSKRDFIPAMLKAFCAANRGAEPSVTHRRSDELRLMGSLLRQLEARDRRELKRIRSNVISECGLGDRQTVAAVRLLAERFW